MKPTNPNESSTPTKAFRRESWRLLQLGLDPLGQPRPLPAAAPASAA
jgi:hypothetical protein